jgi:hypothetical protein
MMAATSLFRQGGKSKGTQDAVPTFHQQELPAKGFAKKPEFGGDGPPLHAGSAAAALFEFLSAGAGAGFVSTDFRLSQD